LSDAPVREKEWLGPLAYVLTAAALLPAGLLLYTRQRLALSLAMFLLLAGGLGLASQAFLMNSQLQHPGGAVGKALVVMPAILLALLMVMVDLFAFIGLMQFLATKDSRGPAGSLPEPLESQQAKTAITADTEPRTPIGDSAESDAAADRPRDERFRAP
jgi:hypothetical protein